MSTASALDLTVDDAIVLHDSNKLAVRLLPCDVLARVAHVASAGRTVRSRACSTARREPRAPWLRSSLEWSRASTSVTASWSRCGPTTNLCHLARSHRPTTRTRSSGCMPACGSSMSRRRTSRIESRRLNNSLRAATSLRRSPTRTGSFSAHTLRSLRRAIGDRGAAEQLLHGEPHPGNVLSTKNGPLFIDLETCCRGPVEFDLAHVPEEVSERYPDADQELLRECRILVLAMVAAWRWDRDDQLPNGQRAAATTPQRPARGSTVADPRRRVP